MYFTYALLSGLAFTATAAPSVRHALHEKRSHLPSGWAKTQPVDKQLQLPMRIGLKQSNIDSASDLLNSISDPNHEKYGNHMTHNEIIDLFSPAKESVDAVKGWLSSYGISADRVKQSFDKAWLEFSATAAEVEDMLKTEYHMYEHSSGKPHVACEEYSVPAHIQEHVDIITPTLHFDQVVRGSKSEKTKRAVTGGGMWGGPKQGPDKVQSLVDAKKGGDPCATQITSSCLRSLYNIPKGSKNLTTFGIVEYYPETFLQSDLNLFEQDTSSTGTNSGGEPVGTAPKFEAIDGGSLYTASKSFDYQGEPDLDLEYAIDLVYPQQITLLQAGDNGRNAAHFSFNNFLDGIDASYCTFQGGDNTTYDEVFPDKGGWDQPEQCGVWAPPKVISTSYGYNEHDLTPAYEQRQCTEYMKLGLAGVSFIFSSGDYGVAGNGGVCINADGSYNAGGSGRFTPAFPSTCPWVTSVGATQIKKGGSVTKPEVACQTVIQSGGGFSDVFAMPSYQASAVATYFANNKPSYKAVRYNNTQQSRGFPDVSANGANYVVYVDGEASLVYGTSASAPVFASIITLINNERAAANKSSLGFLNTALYANPSMFNDITAGRNPGCGTQGFKAVVGWDPVTGLGTPNYTKMLSVLLNA